ncbi:hypothetical protein PR202_ga29294 [Eleusine coracana subsp. coracana]|uniref:Uncharacterized protein n=1 Tax=Eleusine coracana subsp. coracana TaxID=191504 RepID=A0AAV5DMK2_ELECO|nr:hypothetical protein PR202_ga29294 [Eleusine coracana subsp. coracana]
MDWEASTMDDLSKKRDRPEPQDGPLQIQKRLDDGEKGKRSMGSSRQSSETESEASKAGFVSRLTTTTMRREAAGSRVAPRRWRHGGPAQASWRCPTRRAPTQRGGPTSGHSHAADPVSATGKARRNKWRRRRAPGVAAGVEDSGESLFSIDPVFIEILLKVKGAVESEDKILNFDTGELVVSLIAHKLSDGSTEFKDVYFELQ